MPSILLLGSGYVAKPCADILLRRKENKVTVASRSLHNAQSLCSQLNSPNATAVSVDVSNTAQLESLIAAHDLTISLIPYTHHARVIQAAIKAKKNVVTTSYINPEMAALNQAAKDAGITVLNEIGLDPGIDHLYAVKTFAEVHAAGGKIKSFVSYCGGLPAPECSNNPLGYKFSWSSRGVLMALRNNAKFLRDGKVVDVAGKELMKSAKSIYTGYPAFAIVGYANRDSTPYAERYSIPEAETILRGTLRYNGFPLFIQALADLGYLSEEVRADFNTNTDATWHDITCKQVQLADGASESEVIQAMMNKSAGIIKSEEERHQLLMGFKWLGLHLKSTPIQGRGCLLDTLCALLESKMRYEPGERDMVLLQHTFVCQMADGKLETRLSNLLEYGDGKGTSAMAKTVGVPCGVATQLVLDGVLKERGVIAPMSMSICAPLIVALEAEGISMTETVLDG